MWKKVSIAVLVVWGAYSWVSSRSVSHSPGVLAPHEPEQLRASSARAFDLNGYRITPLAQFSIEARVLSREDYRLGREADMSPTDLVFGWGRMSDEAVLKNIDINQSNRFYYWQTADFPIPQREIEISSANMHIIPGDRLVERELKNVRKGQVVRLRGYLVRADAADGWNWVSSLTRNDTGAGACEIIWVEHLAIVR